MDTEYTFHLVLRTSAGTYSSEKLTVRTHKMTDLSGITITPGYMPSALRESLQVTADRIGAKIVDTVRIDTTHFVCTEGRGPAWEKAAEMNIPVVVPDWVKGCEREGRIVGVRGYYLNADPRLRQIGPGAGAGGQQGGQAQQGQQQQQVRSPPLPSPRTEVTPPTPERPTRERRSPEPEESQPPPPPPKDEASSEKIATGVSPSPSPEPEPKSQTEEQKVRTEDLKPTTSNEGKPEASERDEDSEEDSDAGNSAAKAAEAGLPERSKPGQPTVEDDEDDGGSFQEVAL